MSNQTNVAAQEAAKTPTKTIQIKPITTLADCKHEANAFINTNSRTIEKRLADLKVSPHLWNVGYGLWLTEVPNPYDDIMNLIRQHQCAILDMWSVFFENIQLKQKNMPSKRNRDSRCKLRGNITSLISIEINQALQ